MAGVLILSSSLSNKPHPADEFPVSSENARMDITRTEAVPVDKERQIFFNVNTTNNGKETAQDIRHASILITSSHPAEDRITQSFFAMLKVNIALGSPQRLQMLPRSGFFFTLPDVIPEDPHYYEVWNSNDQFIYGFVTIRADDQIAHGDKHIYTEKCFYIWRKVAHICGPDTRSYISG